MNTCNDNIPPLFCSQHQDKVHNSTPLLDDSTKLVGIEAGGQALQRYWRREGAADGHSILIVDPDPCILEAYTCLLQAIWPECLVFQALDERVALDILCCIRPSLVLLDLILPNGDGFGMLEAMRSDERLPAIPVIVLTAQVLTQPDMARLNDESAVILIKGVFTAEEMLAHIKQALAGGKKSGGVTRRIVRKAMAYIHEHYAEPLTRDTLANFAAVSSRHLTRCFDIEVGISPVAYLNRYRIREAKRLLRGSEKSIIEIARAVGFSNHAYFDVVFRREVGLAPSNYRQRHQAIDHQQL
jgi:YesN/AraC family two-component response regulator